MKIKHKKDIDYMKNKPKKVKSMLKFAYNSNYMNWKEEEKWDYLKEEDLKKL